MIKWVMRKVCERLDEVLFRRYALRAPDFEVQNEDGSPYMKRWFVIPHNRFFNIYYHWLMSSDTDRALHDHRAHNISIILSGGYREYTTGKMSFIRKVGHIVCRRAQTPHRIALFNWQNESEVMAKTLFIKLPDFRQWGFHTKDGWVHHNDFETVMDGVSKRKAEIYNTPDLPN